MKNEPTTATATTATARVGSEASDGHGNARPTRARDLPSEPASSAAQFTHLRLIQRQNGGPASH